MANFTVYGFCLIVTASFVALLSMSTDFFVHWVNDIVIPCQHDSVWNGVSCNCDNTRGVYGGTYCDECQCEHQGICSLSNKGGSSNRWGCLCPPHHKWTGVLCDKCYAEVNNQTLNECSGPCLNTQTHEHFGPKCDTVCVPGGSSNDAVCREIASGGGRCNACNGHGACGPNGGCDCEEGWFDTLGGEQCALSCETAGIDCPETNGICRSIGGELQCVCAPGFYGKNCDLSCGSIVQGKTCSGHGTCGLTALGVPACTCTTHYVGEMCEHACPGDQSFPSTCSGHGSCTVAQDPSTGTEEAVCSCDANSLWSGFDCSCNSRFSCSGHGVCKDDASCECNDWSEPSHQHWSGEGCQKCSEHWYGRECHLRCDPDVEYTPDEFAGRDVPRDGVDIGCNGFGTCDVIPTASGERVQCSCRGTDPTWFCAKCEANYYPLTSSETAGAYCTTECNEGTCSFRGVCNDDYDGTNDLCICNTITVGTVEFDTLDPTRFCSTCKENWFPDEMSSNAPCTHYCAADGTLEGNLIVFGEDRLLQGDENAQKVCARSEDGWTPDPDCRVCSGEGTCRGDGECECGDGVTGLYCEIDCGTTANGQVCNGHGRCVRNDLDMWFDPFTTDYRCECQPYDAYTSETRQRLLKRGFVVEPPPSPNFYGEYCEFHCPRYNEDICAGRGDCKTGIAVPDTTIESEGLQAGVPKDCNGDDDCSGIPGAFCAQLSSPWDSLMSGSKSFFSSGPSSPGYFPCATSQNCLDAIYSIEWDDYCVNMLNGWYPSELNTASCTYHVDETLNCREKVENFFIGQYKDSGKTWCESALEELSPVIMTDDLIEDNTTVCSSTTHASEQTYNLYYELCHSWTLESACNANAECMYDQTIRYIEATDSRCESLVLSEGKCCLPDGDCPSECHPSDDGTACETKTYCRARHCKDAIIENNVESLCVDVEPACPTDDPDYWTSFCTQTSGTVRALAEMSARDTFYTCVMYDNSMNPQQISLQTPGNVDIFGTVTIAPEENVPIQDYRAKFLASRTLLDKTSFCGDALSKIDFRNNDFCENHLSHILPAWYSHQTERANWFREYMVVCSSGIESIYSTSARAEDRAALLNASCTVHYKCQNRLNRDWDATCDDTDSDMNAYGWTLKCLTSGETKFDTVDWSMFPEDVSDCTLHENTFATRWGATQWFVNDVIDKYTENCARGLEASWIPKESPIPGVCEMGACADGHTCVPCSEDTMLCNQGVFCRAPNNVNCFEDMPCQNGGECYQPYFFASSNKYLCEWEHSQPVLAYVGDSEYKAVLTSRNILVISGVAVAQGPIVLVQNETWSVMQEPSIFNDEEARVAWTASWNNCPALFCPLTAQCVTNCSNCGSAHGKMCTGQAVEPKETGAVLPPDIETCSDDDDFNWYEYCAAQSLGTSLKTSGSAGLGAPWTGTTTMLAPERLQIVDVRADVAGQTKIVIDIQASDPSAALSLTIDNEETVWHVQGEVIAFGNYVRTVRQSSGQLEILHLGNASTSIALKAMFGATLVLNSLAINGNEQLKSFADTVDPSRFYMGTEENVTNYKSWSFDEDGTATLYREQYETHPPTRQCSFEADGNNTVKVCNADSLPTNGQRWKIDSSYQKRVHGWTKFQPTRKKVANMDVFNGDFSPIVRTHIYQNRLYVNDVATDCRVEATQWWHWTIDVHAVDESNFVNTEDMVINEFLIADAGQTLFRQTWDIHVHIGSCSYDGQYEMVTTAGEHQIDAMMGTPFHHVTATPEHECRAHCHTHEDCRQWSWTPHAQDCFLHSASCHEGGCTLGSHTMNVFHARGVEYFDAWSSAKNVKVSWNHIRAEDIIDAPFACPVVDIAATIPQAWQEDFSMLYTPLDIDATSVCNSLHTMWETLPGYETGHCSTSDDCPYVPHDMSACANYMEYAVPDVSGITGCDGDKDLFLELDWTSYCRYEQSFIGDIPFIGGRDIFTPVKSLDAMCETVRTIQSSADATCASPVDSEWFGNCFGRTAAYEDFCSADCVEHIESMLDEVEGDPSICTIRKEYLDLSALGLDTDCKCSLGDMIVTDFCLVQNAYHVGNQVKVPELYNSDCSTSCTQVLQDSMDRPKWRQWCQDLSSGRISGTCSKTVCECNTENIGVAGTRCELSCPSGDDNGEELACSGRNGRCFAVNEDEITEDAEKQQLNGEYRNASFAGPNIPVWQRGPSPTADGRCQCALGSGLMCSIPCDKCNNGTYGSLAASQHGICDSFNGVCRGLAPWMRYNTDKALSEGFSINTTSFENAIGLTQWKHSDRFVFESDATLLEQSLRYVSDQSGVFQTQLEDPTLEEENAIVVLFDVFGSLCWHENVTNFEYLDNEQQFIRKGLDMNLGTLDMKTTYTEESGLCTIIEYSDSLTLCYSKGTMYAQDTGSPLIVRVTSEAEFTRVDGAYLNGMSFTVHSDGHIYAFGGQWDYGPTQQNMNQLYKITVSRVPWSPSDIVFLSWAPIQMTGSLPPGQVYAPLATVGSSLYLLSWDGTKHTMFRFTLPTPLSTTGTWSVVEQAVPSAGFAKNMKANDVGQIYIYFSTQTWLFTPEANEPFVQQTGRFESTTLSLLTETFSKFHTTCSLSLATVGETTELRVGGQTLARVAGLKQSVRIFMDEWLNIDTSTKASITRRFMNTVTFDVPSPVDVSALTEARKMLALDLVERVYMHQARWISAELMFVKTQLAPHIWPDSNMFRHVTLDKTVFTADFENVFDTLGFGFFSADVQSTPTYLSVNIEGSEPNRRLSIRGNYIEEKAAYTQRFYIGTHKMELYMEWTDQSLRLKLGREGDSGYVRWLLTETQCRTFVIDISLEDWLRGAVDVLAEDSYRHEFSARTGRAAMFNLFVSREVSYTHSMMTQLTDFLAYSPSHCSVTASVQCPGLLPYLLLPCSGHGRCNSACQCTCEVAPSVLQQSDTALQSVDRSDSPYRGKGCEITCPGYDGYYLDSVCSGRGVCQFDGSCSCPQGYTGNACQFKCPIDEDGTICSAHGGCGTRATEISSFSFGKNDYLDTITAINKKNYVMALSSFYTPCKEFNYIRQRAEFTADVNLANGDFNEAAPALDRCEDINLAIRQNADLNRDEQFRDYPYGMCIGVIEDLPSYKVATLRKPETRPLFMSFVTIFDCVAAECTFEPSDTNEDSIRGLETRLLSPSFEIRIKYVHGASSGTVHYLVNGLDFYMVTDWTAHSFKIELLNTLGFTNTTIHVPESVMLFRMVVEDGKPVYQIYKNYFPSPSEKGVLFLAPLFEEKYVRLVDTIDDYVLVEDLPYTERDTVEHACDMEPLCEGIVQWDTPFRENLFSLYSESAAVEGFESYSMPSNAHTFYRKMSLVYQGRDSASKCDTISSNRAQYPRVQYTETYDIPIENIDLSLAKDDETPSIIIGNGLWTQCWTRVDAGTKTECYEKARDAGTFGFAFSEAENVCLVYREITDPTRIKLGRYNSESRLNIFHPCNTDTTSWRPIQ